MRQWLVLAAFVVSTQWCGLSAAGARGNVAPEAAAPSPPQVWRDSTCAGCHGPTARGAVGPSLAGTKLPLSQFEKIVRKGRGKMPSFDASEMTAVQIASIHKFVQSLSLASASDVKRFQKPAAKGSPAEVFAASSCAGCHGPTAMGGVGPPLAGTQLSLAQVEATVRHGKGLMPAVPESEMSRDEIVTLYSFVHKAALDVSQIPLSDKITALLSVRHVGLGLAGILLLTLVSGTRVVWYWLNWAGWRQIRPHLRQLGYGRAVRIVLQSLLVDGLLVASLWRRSKSRWLIHGLFFYGFLGLALAGLLMPVFNPERGELPFTPPLRLLPNLAGFAVLIGILIVRYRYSTDPYEDPTSPTTDRHKFVLGRDYVFLTLLSLAILTGFFVQILRAVSERPWILPFYLIYLAVVTALLLSAPFTGFAHALVTPALGAMMRLVEALEASGVELQLVTGTVSRQPRHAERVAVRMVAGVAPGFEDTGRLMRAAPAAAGAAADGHKEEPDEN